MSMNLFNRRARTPQSLIHRVPGNKEHEYWKQYVDKEEAMNTSCGAPELPWLEAASQRYLPGCSHTVARFTSPLAFANPSLYAMTHAHNTGDKAVDRACMQKRPTQHIPSEPPQRWSVLLSSTAGEPLDLVMGCPSSSRLMSPERRQLRERIHEVQGKLDSEKRRTEAMRQALAAATYQAIRCDQATIWGPRDISPSKRL